jgi:hypothetical protein
LGKFAGKVKQVYNSGPEIALREKKRVGISYILDKNNSYYEMSYFFLSTNIHVNILKWIKKSKNLITKRSRIVLLEQWLEKKIKTKTHEGSKHDKKL